MSALIEALTIFLKYKDAGWPTNCSHDQLAIMAIGFDEVSVEDRMRLQELGFIWKDDEEVWISFKYGSA